MTEPGAQVLHCIRKGPLAEVRTVLLADGQTVDVRTWCRHHDGGRFRPLPFGARYTPDELREQLQALELATRLVSP